MKNKIVSIVLLLISTQLFSQRFEDCDFDNENLGRSFCNITFPYTASIDPAYLATFNPVVFNLHFWGINKSDGSSDRKLTLEDALEIIANLNIEFNPYNIYFKYSGTNYINSTAYYIYDGDELQTLYDYASNNGYRNFNALNFYVPYDISGYSGTANMCYGSVIVRSLRTENWHSVHEMGHLLGLRHTYYSNPCENVTRDPLNIRYNADIAGDDVIDTAATVRWIDNTNVNPLNCKYLGNEVECSDLISPPPLEIFEQDILNYMQQDLNECRFPPNGVFTIGQAIRMREAILDDPTGNFTDATTTIASLYQPYDGVYKPCCWGIGERPPVFQPGFDYEFVYCQDEIPMSAGRTEPWPWGDLSFTIGDVVYFYDKFFSDYDDIEHLNHTAVRILQIENQPRCCYSDYSISSIGSGEFNEKKSPIPEIELFPNPTRSILKINSETEINEIVIFDKFGQKVYSISHSVPFLNLESLPTDLYFVKLSTSEGEFVKQIIKK